MGSGGQDHCDSVDGGGSRRWAVEDKTIATPSKVEKAGDGASDSDETKRLRDSQKKVQQNDCIFCKIVCGESPALKLYEDDACLCILDTNPLSHGHSLIIPKSHFCSLKATPPHVIAAMCLKVPFISSATMKATGCGVYLYFTAITIIYSFFH
ncbi:adenylylsulfatase HINT3-like [Juglans regia]|uniref:Adenylylsulfatase HINT3-like n=1 Tax=Juglans regia TaxID=51240 RepID=A0A6P9EJY9_JUGRE|nr:adenylylsulfatase HINT3-like [Juglans regia]